MTATTELAPLILAGDGYSLEVSPDAEAQKAELIRHSALIVEVNDNTAAEAARNQVKKLAEMRVLVEKSRKAVKEPVLKIGKDIDAKAAAFVGQIELEEKRVSGLIGAHAQRVEAERQALLRKQQEEERQRIAAEQEAARKAAEAAAAAEAARKAAEDAQFADDATEDTEAAAKAAVIAAEAEKVRIAAEQAEAARKAEEARAAAFAAPIEAPVSGVKFEPDFELVDIHALYAAVPELVKLEVKRADTLARIKSYMEAHGGDLPTVPGLSITKKPVVSKR
jgi:hypothetical protein